MKSDAVGNPIFIVGTPRSGTTLLAALISSHSKISCGPETHFFAQTSSDSRREAVEDSSWPNRAVQLLASLQLQGKSLLEAYGVGYEEIDAFLRNESASERALLRALTYTYARKADKEIWVEKTPRHIRHVDTIKRVYPESLIVQIIRDPRDTVRSLDKVPWTPSSVFANAVRWKEEELITRRHKGEGSFFTVRYEDLLLKPYAVLQDICDFIGVQFEEAMVDPSSSAENVISENEPWKEKVRKPIDPSNAFKWKREMSHREAQLVSLICHEGIEQHGYPDPIRPKRIIPVYGLTRSTADRIHEDITALAERRILLVPVQSHKLKWLRVPATQEMAILELPSLGNVRVKRLLNLMRMCGRAVLERVRGTVVYRWPGLTSSSSLSDRLIEVVLSALSVRIEKISDE